MPDLNTLFQSITPEALRQFVEHRMQEGLHLEFKTLGNGRSFARDDRKNLAIAISGFANAEGGVVIWGIRAAPDAEGLDAANELLPLSEVDRAHSDLTSHIPQATSPIIAGVSSRVVRIEGANAGCLVMLVPPSEVSPCMAKLGVDRYMVRTGSSFRNMEHHAIADMFGRRKKPALELSCEVSAAGHGGGPGGNFHSGRVTLGIRNTGRGIGQFPAIALSIEQPYRVSRFGLDGNGRTGLPKLVTPPGDRLVRFAGGINEVVHIESILNVTCIEFEVREGNASPTDLVIQYRISAEDIAPIAGELRVAGSDIAMIVREAGGSRMFFP